MFNDNDVQYESIFKHDYKIKMVLIKYINYRKSRKLSNTQSAPFN